MVTAQNRRSNLLPSRPTPVTTNRNNLNRPRIFSFRAKLQTPQFVSTPSCVTMKLNRGTFSGKETRNRSIERFQDMQFLPFQQSAKKTRSFFSGFQASEPAAPIATGVQ